MELPGKPGQWESFDVTLVGRYPTIIRNGVKMVDAPPVRGARPSKAEQVPLSFALALTLE